jgi:hypothetical protein
MAVVVYLIYVQLFTISRVHFLYVHPEHSPCYSKWDLIYLTGKICYSLIFQSPDGKYIASGAIDGIINIFDVASGKLVHTLEGIIWSVS